MVVMTANKHLFVLEFYVPVLQNSSLLRSCHIDGKKVNSEKNDKVYMHFDKL